jgi:hypothetical protein
MMVGRAKMVNTSIQGEKLEFNALQVPVLIVIAAALVDDMATTKKYNKKIWHRRRLPTRDLNTYFIHVSV